MTKKPKHGFKPSLTGFVHLPDTAGSTKILKRLTSKLADGLPGLRYSNDAPDNPLTTMPHSTESNGQRPTYSSLSAEELERAREEQVNWEWWLTLYVPERVEYTYEEYELIRLGYGQFERMLASERITPAEGI